MTLRSMLILSAVLLLPGLLMGSEVHKKGETRLYLGDSFESCGFKLSREVEIFYGFDENTIGFQSAGDERQALGPSWFEVEPDGTIMLADPVHGKIHAVIDSNSKEPLVNTVASLEPGEGVPQTRDFAARAEMTGAESGAVVFGGEISSPVRINLEIGGPLASIRVLGLSPAGSAFVLLERFRNLGASAVDREILLISPKGELEAQMPIEEKPAAAPSREFQVREDGVLYRMVPGEKSVVFMIWEVR